MPATSTQAKKRATARPKANSQKKGSTAKRQSTRKNGPTKAEQAKADKAAAEQRKREREQREQERSTMLATVTERVPDLVTRYVKKHADSDPLAPMHGNPFVQGDRVYLQLEGRATEGLLGFVRSSRKDMAELAKGVLRQAILDAGFSRKPFSYQHPEKGQTSASYFSAPVGSFDGLGDVKVREVQERAAKSGQRRTAARKAAEGGSIPMRPEGTDEQVARLDELEKAQEIARDAWKQSALDGKPKDEQQRLEAAYHEAKDTWVAHRKAMHSAKK